MAGPEADDGWHRLWWATRPEAPTHPIDLGALGEYALLLRRDGPASATRALPEVAAHLQAGCADCAADLAELAAWVEEEEPPLVAADAPGGGRPPAAPPARPGRDPRFWASRLTAGVLAAGLAAALLVGVSRLPWSGTVTIGEEISTPAPAPSVAATPAPTAAPASGGPSAPATATPPAATHAPVPIPSAAATATAAIAVVSTAQAQGAPTGGTGACSPNQQPFVEPAKLTIQNGQNGVLAFRDRNNACIMWYALEVPDWLKVTAEQRNKQTGRPEAVELLPDPTGQVKVTTLEREKSTVTIEPKWALIRATRVTEGQIVLREDDKTARRIVLVVRVSQDRQSVMVEVGP